ncbi:LysR family transcriptional regulator [Bradyrhizobium sp. Ash2021]|uniref:LysR family transcriptional regulator n=1 Tax=Bradyrhizobium sp. Ash2021 TaxID=2954771 RepID=UPI00281681C9|nr:LysR family transcriptional regulator [Bradyrhizobium sp. Ash2021]WMT76410.1 LysR family transcriptional regulator [Bradyrhizobium sp. Ash2021]
MDRLTSMKAFVTTADAGSFSEAARRLAMSPSMVTKHVEALEHRLGVQLLHRSTRRLVLTEAGAEYRDRCRNVLAEVDEIEASASADRLEPRGLLRINVPVSFGVRHIAPLLPNYARLYPAITVELGLNNRLVDLVEEGWDIAVRFGSPASSALIARRLGVSRMVVCAAPEYLAAHGSPRTVADLAQHNCLRHAPAGIATALPWQFQGPYGSVAQHVCGNLLVSDPTVLHTAALAGQGILFEPTFLVGEDLAKGRLVEIVLDQTPLSIPIHALWSPGRRLSSKVRSFVDLLAEHMRPVPPWDRELPRLIGQDDASS